MQTTETSTNASYIQAVKYISYVCNGFDSFNILLLLTFIDGASDAHRILMVIWFISQFEYIAQVNQLPFLRGVFFFSYSEYIITKTKTV